MKKLFTSILILISALTYSQNLSIEDLNIENDHEAKRKEKITHFYSPKNMF